MLTGAQSFSPPSEPRLDLGRQAERPCILLVNDDEDSLYLLSRSVRRALPEAEVVAAVRGGLLSLALAGATGDSAPLVARLASAGVVVDDGLPVDGTDAVLVLGPAPDGPLLAAAERGTPVLLVGLRHSGALWDAADDPRQVAAEASLPSWKTHAERAAVFRSRGRGRWAPGAS